MLPLSVIFLLDYITVPSVWYIMYNIIHSCLHMSYVDTQHVPMLPGYCYNHGL
jgi:hypothetical protein